MTEDTPQCGWHSQVPCPEPVVGLYLVGSTRPRHLCQKHLDKLPFKPTKVED